MTRLPLFILLVMSLSGSFGCGGSAMKSASSASRPADSQPADHSGLPQVGPQMHTLSNGLKVAILEMPGVGVATADVWINAGAANESGAVSGVSHFLEHMLFKGTDMHAPGEMDRIVEGVGGILNAGTSKDFTHYYMTVPAAEIHTAIDALGDAITTSTLATAEFEKERGVILEEISRKEDSPYGFLFEKLYETAFASGPYHHSVLGETSTIAAMTRDMMWAYYKKHYVPGNMLLVVAGDVDAQSVLQASELAFARSAASQPASNEGMPPFQWRSGADVTIPRDVREAYVAVAFPAPGIMQPESVYAADLLQAILSEGNAARLNRELKERLGLVSNIGASYPTHRHDSLFTIIATLDPERVGEYRESLMKELDRARDKKFDAATIRRAKKLLTNSHYFSKETTGGAAAAFGYYFTLTGSPEFEAKYIESVAAVTDDQVRDAARQIFDPQKAVWITLTPSAQDF